MHWYFACRKATTRSKYRNSASEKLKWGTFVFHHSKNLHNAIKNEDCKTIQDDFEIHFAHEQVVATLENAIAKRRKSN